MLQIRSKRNNIISSLSLLPLINKLFDTNNSIGNDIDADDQEAQNLLIKFNKSNEQQNSDFYTSISRPISVITLNQKTYCNTSEYLVRPVLFSQPSRYKYYSQREKDGSFSIKKRGRLQLLLFKIRRYREYTERKERKKFEEVSYPTYALYQSSCASSGLSPLTSLTCHLSQACVASAELRSKHN